jgi:hypothetical protein
MILTILPKSGDDGGAQAAQVKLQTVIDDVETVVLIAYGEGPEINRVIEIAVGRADVEPYIRRVVWCPDSSVLSAEQRASYFQKDKAVVTIGLADKIAGALDIVRAQLPLHIELAFSKAETQGRDK